MTLRCKNCNDRTENCHSGCLDYLFYDLQRIEMRKNRLIKSVINFGGYRNNTRRNNSKEKYTVYCNRK